MSATCKHCNVCEFRGETTCKDCGLVLNVNYIDYSFDYEHQYIVENDAVAASSFVAKGVSKFVCYDVSGSGNGGSGRGGSGGGGSGSVKSDECKQFQVTCEQLRMPAVISEVAIDIFGSFVATHMVKGWHRALCMMACIYHAQCTTNSGITVCKSTVCGDKGFQGACNEIEEFMKLSPKWGPQIKKVDVVEDADIGRCIGRIMAELGVAPSNQPEVRPLAIKVYDKSKGYSGLVGIKDSNFYMACVYVACALKKINMENKKMVKGTNQKIVALISKALKQG